MTRFPDVDIRQPQPFDLVDQFVRIAGIINIGDEGGSARVFDANGDELAVSANRVAGRDLGGGDFALTLEVPSTPTQTGTVRVTMLGGATAEVPVTFGHNLIPAYGGFAVHVVESGDTLSSIAARYLEDADRWPIIAVANRDVVEDPNLIVPGQELRVPLDASLL